MWDKRAYAAHVRLKSLNEFQILCKCFRRLIRTAHHETAADLEANFLQIAQAAHSIVKGHGRRVELFIMLFIRRFMAQQITICTRRIHIFIVPARIFPERERNGAVEVLFSDFRYDPA